jgi:hypothetical protein
MVGKSRYDPWRRSRLCLVSLSWCASRVTVRLLNTRRWCVLFALSALVGSNISRSSLALFRAHFAQFEHVSPLFVALTSALSKTPVNTDFSNFFAFSPGPTVKSASSKHHILLRSDHGLLVVSLGKIRSPQPVVVHCTESQDRRKPHFFRTVWTWMCVRERRRER